MDFDNIPILRNLGVLGGLLKVVIFLVGLVVFPVYGVKYLCAWGQAETRSEEIFCLCAVIMCVLMTDMLYMTLFGMLCSAFDGPNLAAGQGWIFVMIHLPGFDGEPRLAAVYDLYMIFGGLGVCLVGQWLSGHYTDSGVWISNW